MRALVVFITLITIVSPVSAHQCRDLETTKKHVTAYGATWTDLSSAQTNFLRGVYAMDPNTASGLPFGDRAALAVNGGNGVVFFIDGNLACQPMEILETGLQMLRDIEAGVITHEPSQ